MIDIYAVTKKSNVIYKITCSMRTAVAVVVIFLCSHSAQAQFTGGDGSEDDPFQVQTIEQLQLIGDTLYLDRHFIQTADIDASVTSQWNDGDGFDPIGDIKYPFSGSYNGNGHQIMNLAINRENQDHVGLFGYIVGGVVEHLALEDLTVRGQHGVGGLAGMNRGIIRSSYVSGSIVGGNYVGGIAGYLFGIRNLVYDSSVRIEVRGEENVGGLVGWSEGQVRKCHAHGEVSGMRSVGGLIGLNGVRSEYTGIVYASWSAAEATGIRAIGGLVGFNSDRVFKSYATGPVTGQEFVGGIAGVGSGQIRETYAIGRITGDKYTGGLAGSYSSIFPIRASYWDTLATGQLESIGAGNPEGATGLSTEQMTGQNAGIYMHEFDFEQVWQLTEGYPALRWQKAADSVEVPEAAIITVSEREYDFGEVAIGDTVIHEFRIVNKGNIQMHAEVALPVPTEDYAMVFSIIEGEGTYDLEPDSTHSVVVGFVPKAVRDYTELILVVHDAQNEDSVLEIRIKGLGKLDISAEEVIAHQPDRVRLHQNYPNPFNPVTTISYDLPEHADVSLEIFDILGRRVAVLVSETQNPGTYQISWDASDVASGSYMYRLRAGEFVQTRTMMLVK